MVTLGGAPREEGGTGREGRGAAVQGLPAINYSVYRGRAGGARGGQEGEARSHRQRPRHPHLHPQAAAHAAAQEENHDGSGETKPGAAAGWMKFASGTNGRHDPSRERHDTGATLGRTGGRDGPSLSLCLGL